MSYIVPKDKPNCFYCPFRDMDDCKLTGKVVTLYANTLSTSGDCPLVEIPTPHGRLIDADALHDAMYHRAFETDGDTMWQSGCWVRFRAIEQVHESQPTIIEAEALKAEFLEATLKGWSMKYTMPVKGSDERRDFTAYFYDSYNCRGDKENGDPDKWHYNASEEA